MAKYHGRAESIWQGRKIDNISKQPCTCTCTCLVYTWNYHLHVFVWSECFVWLFNRKCARVSECLLSSFKRAKAVSRAAWHICLSFLAYINTSRFSSKKFDCQWMNLIESSEVFRHWPTFRGVQALVDVQLQRCSDTGRRSEVFRHWPTFRGVQTFADAQRCSDIGRRLEVFRPSPTLRGVQTLADV